MTSPDIVASVGCDSQDIQKLNNVVGASAYLIEVFLSPLNSVPIFPIDMPVPRPFGPGGSGFGGRPGVGGGRPGVGAGRPRIAGGADTLTTADVDALPGTWIDVGYGPEIGGRLRGPGGSVMVLVDHREGHAAYGGIRPHAHIYYERGGQYFRNPNYPTPAHPEGGTHWFYGESRPSFWR